MRQSNDHLAAAALCEVRLEEVEQSGLHATQKRPHIVFHSLPVTSHTGNIGFILGKASIGCLTAANSPD